MGPIHLRATFEDVLPALFEKVAPCLKDIQSGPTQPIKGLGLSGKSGVGKSQFLAAVMLHLAERIAKKSLETKGYIQADLLPLWVHWPTYVKVMHGKGKLDPQGYEAMKEYVIQARILMLDDLGAEQAFESDSSFARDLLLTVLEDRCAFSLPVFWTSNQGSRVLSERYQDNVLSRLSELAFGMPVPEGLPDRRLMGIRTVSRDPLRH